jgi:hypothetical protein
MPYTACCMLFAAICPLILSHMASETETGLIARVAASTF